MATDGSHTMPHQVPIEGEEEEEMEEVEDDDDDETQVPPQSRKHKEMIDYKTLKGGDRRM